MLISRPGPRTVTQRQTHLLLPLLTVIIVWLLLTSSSFAQTDWEEVNKPNSDNIQIYTRKIPDSDIKAFKGIIEINTSLDSALALFNDVAAIERWLFQCEAARELEVVNFQERYTYHINDLPAFYKKRDYILHVRLESLPDRQGAVLHLRSDANKYPKTKYIRIKKANGYYRVEKISEQRVRITWEQHIEPGGWLPDFLVNSLLYDTPLESLAAFKREVMKQKYQQQRLLYDTSDQIIGLDYL